MPSRMAYAIIAVVASSRAAPDLAQGNPADYARANGLRAKDEGFFVRHLLGRP